MASQYVGTLRGDLAVDSDGGASYAVPIDVPPGTSNLMPTLSVAYNSGGGPDLLGVGWSLRGLSCITRAPQTPAQDGAWAAVTYGPGDRFALDGQRLVPVSGGYGDSDALYHTEVESWTQVVPVYYGQNGNAQPPVPGRVGPDAFIATTKDGKVHEYGTEPDAQIVASSTNPSIRVWALSRITDRFGNTVSFTYTEDAGNSSYYPAAIAYTGNEAAGLAPQRSVVFGFEPRPEVDAVTRYQGGFPVTTTQRLATITTQVNGATVLTYQFGYESGQATGRSRLVSITKADAAGVSLPATTFGWQDAEPGLLAPPSVVGTLPAGGALYPMDVNRDGRIDLVRLAADGADLGVTLLLAEGTGFASPIAVPASTALSAEQAGVALPMDVDGDGTCELVLAGSVGGFLDITILKLTAAGGTWTCQVTANAGPENLGDAELLALDVDGDGLVDLVAVTAQGPKLMLQPLFSDGSSFAPAQPAQSFEVPVLGGTFLSLDVNGDGMTDLVYATVEGAGYALTPLISQGRAGFAAQPTVTPGLASTGVLVALDVNADGIGDLVHAEVTPPNLVVTTLASNGMSFETPVATAFAVPDVAESVSSVLPMDVTGDGLPDLTVVTAGQGGALSVSVLLSTCSGFVLASGITQPPATTPRGTFLPVDYLGDGRTSLACAALPAGQSALEVWAMAPAGPYPDLMTSMTNGLGGQIAVTYASLTDPAVYTAGSPAPGQVDAGSVVGTRVSGATLQLTAGRPGPATTGFVPATRTADFPKYVVSGYTRSDGRDNSYGYQHHYAAALLDLTGRGWLGFATMAVSDLSQGTTATTAYNQLFPWTHTPASTVQARTSDQATMNTQAWTYDPPPPVVPPTPVAVVPATRTTGLYTFGTLDLTQSAAFTYDGYGNVTVNAESSSAPDSPPLWTTKTYQNDPTRWRLGFVLTSIVSADAAGTQVLSSTSTTYDPVTWAVAEESAWDDQAGIWQTTSHGYDTFGNETSVTDCSGATTITTFDPTYQTFPATICSPEGAGPTGSLCSFFTYYPGFRVKATSTDPNGVMAGQTIDGLGRVTAKSGPGPDGMALILSTHAWVTDETGTYDEVAILREWTAPVWSWTRRYLDGMGRVYRSASLGPDGVTTLYVDRTFDSRNQVLTETLPYYEGQAPATRSYVYDAYGRTVSVTDPPADAASAAVVTTFSYPTSMHTIQVQAAGTAGARTTDFTYGWYGHQRRVVAVVDNAGASGTFGYDPVGRLLGATDATAHHAFAYDSLGRRIGVAVTPPAGGPPSWFAETVSYDDAARTVTQTDSAGNTVVWLYDALRRPLTKTVNGVPTAFAYDDPAQANAQGRCSQVVLPGGATYTYDYDAYGNQSSITLSLGRTSYTVGRTCKPTGAIDQLTFPDATTLTNAYNAAGSRLSVVEDAGGSTLTAVAYDDFDAYGMAGAVALGNGAAETHAFDALGRPTGITVAAAGGQAVVDQSYAWDALNLLQAISDNQNAANSQSFTFDPVGRLAAATGPYGTEAYTYDGAGNLTAKGGVTFSLDGYRVTSGSAAGEQVLAAGYDAAGSMTSVARGGAATAYGYDGERRLVSAGTVSGLASAAQSAFAYDHTGRRVSKTSPDGTVTYYVAPYYEVVALPGGGLQHTRYTPGAGGMAMAVTVVDAPGGTPPPGIPAPGRLYLHGNHLRSTTAVTSDTGSLVTSLAYQPFGEVSTIDGPDEVRQKFTGKELDVETSLYYFQSRYYDPGLGRFITADDRVSVTGPRLDGMNLYAYVLNDPTGRTDPTGHFSISGLFGDVEHGFSVFGHDVSVAEHATTNFFSNDVGTFFAQHWQSVLTMAIDTEMVVLGIEMLALTPFDGGASDLLGETLLGAGIGGMA